MPHNPRGRHNGDIKLKISYLMSPENSVSRSLIVFVHQLSAIEFRSDYCPISLRVHLELRQDGPN